MFFSMTMTMTAVAEDDSISLMQKQTRVRTQGERIIAAVANHGGNTICVDVTAGNVAPMSGSFTAMSSQQAVVVAAGAIAESKGSFCVPKQELLLLQRTLGLHTAEEFEAAIGKKDPEIPETPENPILVNPNADPADKKVWVEQCPKVSALLQTVDATVSKKKEVAAPKLTDDQKQVCSCRSFVHESVHHVVEKTQKEELLQMLDGTVSKKGGDTDLVATENYALYSFCTQASLRNTGWDSVAALLNTDDAMSAYKTLGITGGWAACDKHWAIAGACGEQLVTHEELEEFKLLPTEDRDAVNTAVSKILADIEA